ncbi:uncharacterized protein A4U43_C10F2930 [Asparagus officinalis]|uniref:Uncharacterized protein n=1 Tax=Asparagus officinalis TaxID=4686 RepID=A0A5P1E0A5_ASPOF|nr:uncharacterized protein A4U43_C10F2930 [Asparagus officinalis]
MYGFNGSPPPLYSITRGQQAHKGVNFASAASGILQPTGNKFVRSNDLIEFFASQRAFNATGGCLEGLNELSYMFYEATRFTELENACCGAGKFNGEAACTPNATVCSNRSQYLFWDSACKIAAGTLFGGPKQFVGPINFAQLAAEDY